MSLDADNEQRTADLPKHDTRKADPSWRSDGELVTISSPVPDFEEAEILHLLATNSAAPPEHPAIPVDLPVTPEHLATIRDSIAEIGQQTPIVLWNDLDGQRYVLDGRTRLAACQELGIPAKYVMLCEDDLHGQTPTEWIIARHAANGATRRLTDTQHALLGALLCKELELAAKQRQQHQPCAADQETGKSYELAAAKLDLPPNAVRQARSVIDDLELLTLIRAGRLSLSTAASIARGKEQQRESALHQALTAEFTRKQVSCRRDSLKLAKRLLGLAKDAKRIAGPAGWSLAWLGGELTAAAARIEQMLPTALCAACGGQGCQTCNCRGWLTSEDGDRDLETAFSHQASTEPSPRRSSA